MVTLSDLPPSFQLYAVCGPCRRMRLLPLDALMTRYGADCSIVSVRLRVRCRVCGQRTGNIRIVYVGRCSRAAEFHYRS